MPRYDFRTPRIYVDAPLYDGATASLDATQANHLINVLRLKPGDTVLVFNGRDGEWQAFLAAAGKRTRMVAVKTRTRSQDPAPDLHFLRKRAPTRIEHAAGPRWALPSFVSPPLLSTPVRWWWHRTRIVVDAIED